MEQSGQLPKPAEIEAEIILPPQSAPPHIRDGIVTRPRLPDLDLRDEPLARKGKTAEEREARPPAEFTQLKCTSTRPPGWGEKKPEVYGNAPFSKG
jgi:hypothetical protein